MNILVTGGLGGIGRPLVQRLVKHGHHVRAVDRHTEECPTDVDCRACDVTDFAAVREAVRGMDAIIHLAALTHPGAGPGHEIFRINTTGTFNIYEAAAQEGIRRVVCASSINALGYNFGVRGFPIQYFPMDEDHPACTSDAYSFSKQTTEEIAAYYWRREGISGVQLRLPWVYHLSGEFRLMMAKYMQHYQEAYQKFQQMPLEEQRAAARRVIAEQEKGRAERWSEKPWDEEGEDDFWEKMDPYMMLLGGYTDFWAIIGGDDTAQAFEKGVTATYEGSHPLYVCEARNSVGIPSAALVSLFYPDALVKRPLAGEETLLSFERARQLIGYEPENSISEAFKDVL